VSKREFNTPIREPWNPVIHHCLKAIDHHVMAYFKTGNEWHLQKAQDLRVYITELKTYIYRIERQGNLNDA
jgi:hypothetical protein